MPRGRSFGKRNRGISIYGLVQVPPALFFPLADAGRGYVDVDLATLDGFFDGLAVGGKRLVRGVEVAEAFDEGGGETPRAVAQGGADNLGRQVQTGVFGIHLAGVRPSLRAVWMPK